MMWADTLSGKDTDITDIGLVKGHAYSVLDAYIVYNKDGSEKAKLIKVRNPWGYDD